MTVFYSLYFAGQQTGIQYRNKSHSTYPYTLHP